MSLVNLIRKRETGNPANDNPAKAANDGRACDEPLAGLAALALANPTEAKTAKFAQVGADGTATDPMTLADARMGKVIDRLRDGTDLRYAMEIRDGADLDRVILTLAIKGQAACELYIPKSRYDAFVLLDLIERHTTRETLQ